MTTTRNRHAPRRWTPERNEKLVSLLEQGHGYKTIARRLRTTVVAVQGQSKRIGVRLLTVDGVYSAKDVARLLGLGCMKVVSRWIYAGLLRASNAGAPDRPLWRVQPEDLWTFMQDRRYWMAWTPESITDADLRAWALELRQGQPRWLRPSEAARRIGVCVHVVNRYINEGILPSQRYGTHWINEADLASFVPPCERPRKKAA